MRKLKIYNFQNIDIDNKSNLGDKLTDFDNNDIVTAIIIRDPYTYFDALLYEYLLSKKSKLFTQDIINMMRNLEADAFVQWLATLHFIPFYNPQTSHLNKSQKIDIVCSELENFDYVIPYEELELFLKNVDFDIFLDKREEKELIFSFNSQRANPLVKEFIEKDLQLYKTTWELWEKIKKYNFRPLH